ncbi:hypothetical protein [Paraburkholderia sp. BL25I1N1]|uniref:hypothetical protein n=1 Tax=Paraburkholderia sp. BL25I1N1 TaxID=1938804 RepID=UPI0011B294B3|nr:hypothetical protein [Paraburkholderia sp. BL25I1N1]
MSSCNAQTCFPLKLHRTLDRFGCAFAADEFWAPNDASPQANGLTLKDGKVSISWNRPSCKKVELDQIQKELNGELFGPKYQQRAYAELLKRGCNVDLAQLGINGRYDHVALKWPDFTPIPLPSGPQPQPEMTVLFEPLPEMTVLFEPQATVRPLPLPPVDSPQPICTMLDELSKSRRFALCSGSSSSHNVMLTFTGLSSPDDPNTAAVMVSVPASPAETGPISPPESPPAAIGHPAAAAAAAGSIGLGALLAGVVKSLSEMFKRKRKSAQDMPNPWRVQDVVVIASLPEPYTVTSSLASPGNGKRGTNPKRSA